jgi:pimeloyl-ACP methyl ester carboxylesterase
MRTVLLLLTAVVVVAVGGGLFLYNQASQGTPATAIEAEYMTADDRLLNVSGTTIRVREQGAADAPVIILLHGFTFSLESFDGWASELAKTHRVIRYDLLGHGLSGPDPQKRYAPDERAAFLLDVMDVLGIEKASLAGNSLGGLIAWKVAAAAPSRVDKLILIDAAAYSINDVTDEPVAVPPPMKFFLTTVPDAGIEATFGLVYADPSKATAERKKLLSDMMKREGNGQAFIEHLEEFVLPDPTADLAKIQAPTLILWGGQDKMIPVEQAAWLDRDIPNSEVKIFEQLGHAPHEEDSGTTLAPVSVFLGGE